MARFEPEYSVIYQVLSEIKKKDTEFSPERVFDFGSGLGSVMWAANSVWDCEIDEQINCDSSKDMNSLADLITKGGLSPDKPSKFKNVFYRANLAKEDGEYSLVTSCFTMFEMANRKERFEIFGNLWNKVKDEGYLVCIVVLAFTGIVCKNLMVEKFFFGSVLLKINKGTIL